ncbi:MAG: amidohydrolase 2 [Mycobacterium sp.]|jgi:predicted TIM-barrel fold metal-dependent hydrolase|nr:amidohydrolase 2 [Mycobacterium sp.]
MPRVISADCHVNEPPWVFDRVPESYRDRAPKMLRGDDGGDGWSFDGKAPKRTFGVEAMAGRAKADYKKAGLRFEEILPGNYDGAAHVADMELDGIDVSVVYPAQSIFTYVEPDRGLALACMKSYNDWLLEDFQGADSKRIVGLPLLPVDDGIDTAVAELDRVLAKGARAAFIPGSPIRPYHDPYYEPFWAAVVEREVPLSYHRTFGGKPQEADWDNIADNNFSAAGTVHRFLASTRLLTYLALSGAFERYPSLQIVAGEVNFGWLPFWAQTMDEQFHNQKAMGTLESTEPPSALLGKNIFVTVLDDHVGFKLVPEYRWLADAAMFSTDYPHSVCLWPESRRHVSELTAGLDPADAEKILSGNAARVYGV